MRPRGNTQEDFLLRMIRQAAEVLRQLRRRLLGGEVSAETIRHDAAAAIDLLLGGQAPVLGILDANSAARLVSGSVTAISAASARRRPMRRRWVSRSTRRTTVSERNGRFDGGGRGRHHGSSVAGVESGGEPVTIA